MNTTPSYIPDILLTAMLVTCESIMASRPPDVVIGDVADPYVHRWHLGPRGKGANAYIHRFYHDDNDRALHDHRYDNVSVILNGRCHEHFHVEPRQVVRDRFRTYSVDRHAGEVVFRQATLAHRITLIDGKPMTSIFFTGPEVRDWGFHPVGGWMHWKEFLDSGADTIGQGTYSGVSG